MPIIQAKIPDELTVLRQWVVWRYQERDGKPTKVPHTSMGYRASATNPDHWSRFDVIVERASRKGFADGIGFVFSSADPYCGIDLDNVWPSDASETPSWAEGILGRFSDTYLEESPSAKGVKIWCRAKAPRCGRWPIEQGAVEIYDHARFFAVTGRSAGVLMIANHQDDVDHLVANLDQDRSVSQTSRISGTIPQGQRHPTLLSLAGTMWQRGMDVDAVEAALLVVNEKQCDPPHSPQHIHKLVMSMQRWER